jgi:hypothetical protein
MAPFIIGIGALIASLMTSIRICHYMLFIGGIESLTLWIVCGLGVCLGFVKYDARYRFTKTGFEEYDTYVGGVMKS